MQRNILSLYGVHGLNLLTPMISLPFLTRFLGPEGYGAYGIYVIVTGVAAQVIELGAGVLATRKLLELSSVVSPTKASWPRSEEVLSETLAHQLVMASVAAVITALGVALYSPITPLAYIFSTVTAAALGMTPVWYYVALSRAHALLGPIALSKLSGTLVIVLLLARFPYVEIALLSFLFSNGWVLWEFWAVRNNVIRSLNRISPRSFLTYIRNSLPILSHRAAGMVYINLPALLVAAWHGLSAAGIFVFADRIIRLTISLLLPITQQLLPLQMQMEASTRNKSAQMRVKAQARVTRHVRWLLLLALASSFSVWATADLVPRIIGGSGFSDSSEIIKLLALQIFAVATSKIMTGHLLAKEREGLVARMTWIAATFFVLAEVLVGRTSLNAFAWIYLSVEIFLAVFFFVAVLSIRRFEQGRDSARL